MAWHIYQDALGRWRWELIDARHNVVSQSARDFLSRIECEKNARRFGFSGQHSGPMDHGSDEHDEI